MLDYKVNQRVKYHYTEYGKDFSGDGIVARVVKYNRCYTEDHHHNFETFYYIKTNYLINDLSKDYQNILFLHESFVKPFNIS
jgi:hypothetical protein